MMTRLLKACLPLFFLLAIHASEAGFLTEFFKEKSMVGAIAPSSQYLTRKMLSSIDFKTAKTLVEFGPGTGVFTDELVASMAEDAKLYLFEVNDSFYQSLAEKYASDERVMVFFTGAEKAKSVLAKEGVMNVDVIVSGLPLAVIPPAVKSRILSVSRRLLRESGSYIQFQYSLNDRGLITQYFKRVELDFTLFNLPPAFIYRATNQ